MTKKDYIHIAANLKALRPSSIAADGGFWEGRQAQWFDTVKLFTRTLKIANPKFDPEKFMGACGIQEPTQRVQILNHRRVS